MKEIISLSLGHYSNFVTSHWLNLQEACFSFNPKFIPDLDNDILFQEGISNHGASSYTPRLLCVDRTGSLGHYVDRERPYEGSLQSCVGFLHEKKVENISCEVPYPKNEFLKDLETLENNAKNIPEAGDAAVLKSTYNLDDSVQTWTDYLVPYLHPRSLNILSNYHISRASEEFSTFAEGLQIWSANLEEQLTDRLRQLLEASDCLQGFHVTSDIEDGFSGLSSRFHEYLRDDCPKTPILSFMPVFGETGSDVMRSHMNRTLNMSLAFSSISDYTDLIVPLGTVETWSAPSVSKEFRNINFRNSLKYHTSALIAAGLDCVTVPYRLRNANACMKDVSSSLNILGRSICALGMSLPFPMTRKEPLIPILQNHKSQLFESLTPKINLIESDVISQTVSSKGIKENELGGTKFVCDLGSFDCKSIKTCLEIFFKTKSISTQSNIFVTSQSFRCPITFPAILKQDLNLKSMIGQIGQLAEYRILAGLHNTNEMKLCLEDLCYQARKINPRRLQSYFYPALEEDDLVTSLEKLSTIALNFSYDHEL